VVDKTIRPSETIDLVDQGKKKEETITREQKTNWDTWKAMKGNAILPREELENCI